ncbi:EAL domain-containing protein [Deinococcus sp. HMF7620]|uniref:EAL domain-containing protein n=1 Tax=Deinococcus arboris TaxID=2682977 RepID=A0A7C9HRN7_9DEIO|nr:EAL domain-containing protein [Deinococcus arboris]MVN87134.1 EAL domain-containing protein [Deinococcus arboris]
MDSSGPENEVSRLEALHRYQVLDTPPEAEFDHITRFAQLFLDVPVVFINLVDLNRIWAKSTQGTPVQELDRAHTCCSQAVTGSEVYTVADLEGHPDLKQEGMMRHGKVRSYAGAPLITRDGHRIGALAVYDTRPRVFTAAEQQFLRELAAIVIDSLELRLMVRRWQAAQHRSAYLAHHDPLTGLPNRLRLLDRAQLAFHQSQRSGDSVGFMILDLDGFKTVNDSLGHSVGDELLKEAGRRLCACIRRDDTVARFGGDEFVILLPKLAEPFDAAGVAQKLLSCLKQPFQIGGRTIELSASVGIAIYPANSLNPEEQDPELQASDLLQAADTAMYAAKAAGKAQYQFYSRAMTLGAQRRLDLRARLTQAIRDGQLTLHYQPQVNLQSGRVVGLEALARWPQADGSWISPLEFVPIAEESHLIHELGTWVLRTACEQLVQWEQLGLASWDLTVNISVKQWQDPNFLTHVQRILRETGFSPGRLVLDVNESIMLASPQDALVLSQALSALGIRVALDDFGTGYSSLSQMQDLCIQQLKLDRSFVRRLGETARSQAVGEAIVTLGRRLGITVVGEGIETVKQREQLTQLACPLGQGYIFGHPVPPNVFLLKYAD